MAWCALPGLKGPPNMMMNSHNGDTCREHVRTVANQFLGFRSRPTGQERAWDLLAACPFASEPLAHKQDIRHRA
eukprot:8277916-Pyramimonas_sp.AAC.1